MPDVVAFGEVLWDIYETGPDRYQRMLGGAPANVTVALARMGIRASLIAGVGRDSFGDALAERLAREAVDTSRLVRLPNRTGIAFVTRGRGGEPSFLFYRDRTADMSVRASHLRSFRAPWAVCGTSTLVHPGLRAATNRFVRLARQGGAALAVDLNVRAHLWSDARTMNRRIAELLTHADLVKASSGDVAALGGVRFVRRHAPNATLVLTDGARPARAEGAHGSVTRPARRARCVDATGAGDAFLAGVLAVLIARGAAPGLPAWGDPAVLSEALDLGHRLGAMAISAVGALEGLKRLPRPSAQE